MMNNVVFMFSPTDEKTLYEQGENRMVINFCNVSRHGPSPKESFTSSFDQLKI